MTPRTRPEISTLVALVTDIAADDDYVLAMLALERNGHPKAQSFAPVIGHDDDHDQEPGEDDGGIDYPDPTGETAIRPDPIVDYGRQYNTQVRRAMRALKHADSIRRRSIPPNGTARKAGDIPDGICRKCFVSPRPSNGSRYCYRCSIASQLDYQG